MTACSLLQSLSGCVCHSLSFRLGGERPVLILVQANLIKAN
uniref:ORF2 protein n=1 Tax=Prochlorothrix hollandica TaxID=1223 RepID=Q05575_PROHO|nr:ORF2 [Prochlorothrix hollandica]